ncbi:MAG: SCO family protein [Chloroflexota bacterium]
MRKLIWFVLITGLMTLIACGGQSSVDLSAHDFNGTYVGGVFSVEDFELESAAGPVKLSDFSEEYVVLYFGYTFCPDFCPITLSQMSTVREALVADGEDLNVIMVTVDPERDTAELLAEYVTFFDDSFVGLTGTPEAIAAAADPFGVFYEIGEVAENKEYYLVNHTTRTFLVGPDGAPLLTWAHEVSTDGIVADIKFLMANG